MENIKTYSIGLLLIAVIVLLSLKDCNGFQNGNSSKNSETIIYKRGKTDTLVTYKDKLVYLKSKGKIQWLKEIVYIDTANNHIDTLKPFISSIDTIISNDTLKVSYAYPLNEFELSLKKRDSILFIKQVDTLNITKTETIEKAPPLWHYILTGLLGISIGAIANR